MVPSLKLVWPGGWGFMIRDDVGEIQAVVAVAGKFLRARDAYKSGGQLWLLSVRQTSDV
jgi:hypothetical protein